MSNRTRWRNQYWYSENASKFHEAFRQFLINNSTFRNLSCYQEVNVKDLIPDYPYTNHHYDWYIKELGWIIELHGRQHYDLVNYGGIGMDSLIVQFNRQRYRDSEKAIAALDNGFHYIAIPYTQEKDLSFELMMQLAEATYETDTSF